MYLKILACIGTIFLGLTAPVLCLVYTSGWSDGVRYEKERVTCPPGTYVEGIRASGASSCVTAPPRGCSEPAGTQLEQRPCVYTEHRTPVQLYCTGGAHPIVIDDRTVGCQR